MSYGYGCGGQVGGVSTGCGYDGWFSLGTILVLFILLVIISKTFFC
ncbi:YjcZ family sporulation protein [Paenibacillus urinalis]|uniref:YjcZ family sporulation protein n=2 Tax=Paenibacillus TaxID=44249 RepID=A0AAX3N5D5_9BACL|nr:MULTISPECIES: hypothetical protein [Paenibacillus]WDH84339.1 YjcZ family sporulation protein [Paenibacillus urinalis]WDH95807.1 YjcZ family sporulation protein [Paenibacillus urinalis]WDI04023.1 YjcZ family sporulation protein [Paenibacillus urinalis]SDW20348.1 conserved hypothetical tiny transmembrane protein [Paenibacillus sp. PDC88]GAK38667.1 hypothetical protein TCA2_0393 [Paenibacillus sp. TCA20]